MRPPAVCFGQASLPGVPGAPGVPPVPGSPGSACHILYIRFARFLVVVLSLGWTALVLRVFNIVVSARVRIVLRVARFNIVYPIAWKIKFYVSIQRVSEQFPNYFIINSFRRTCRRIL